MISKEDVDAAYDMIAVTLAAESIFHPAANLFPMMSDEEIDALGADMMEHGQRETIILFHGKILDGRNRYVACQLNGIEPRCREELPADPYAFVASANLHRRHLDESQRAMIAAKLATLKQGARTDIAPIEAVSQVQAADLLKVSRTSVQRAHIVREHGVPDLVAAVEKGIVRVATAAEFAKSTPPLMQAVLIAEHGSPAAAVRATVVAQADRVEQTAAKAKARGPSYWREKLSEARRAYVDAVEDAELSGVERAMEMLGAIYGVGTLIPPEQLPGFIAGLRSGIEREWAKLQSARASLVKSPAIP